MTTTTTPGFVPPSPINITVAGSGLDVFIPTIPEINEADIIARFRFPRLTAIEDRPDYHKC